MVAIWLRCSGDGGLVVEAWFNLMVLMVVFGDGGGLVL